MASSEETVTTDIILRLFGTIRLIIVRNDDDDDDDDAPNHKDCGTKAAHCVVDASRKKEVRLMMMTVMRMNELLYWEAKQLSSNRSHIMQRLFKKIRGVHSVWWLFRDDVLLGSFRTTIVRDGTKIDLSREHDVCPRHKNLGTCY